MNILMTILSIILFLIALGILVAIHEFGHFIAAKIFNIYCSDFSIGFGPKIIKHKRKKGETTFSLGIVPFGGYVQMYGEGVELPQGVNIPKERSLEGISRWKKIIIFLAGITMNFVLAFLIFVLTSSCFPQLNQDFSINVCEVTNSQKFNETFKDDNGNILTLNEEKFVVSAATMKYDYTFTNSSGNSQTISVNGLNVILSNPNNLSSNLYALSYGSDWGYSKLDYQYMMSVYSAKSRKDSSFSNIEIYTTIDGESKWVKVDEVENFKDLDFTLPIVGEDSKLVSYSLENISSLDSTIYFKKIGSKEMSKVNANFKIENSKLSETGISAYARFEYLGWNSFALAGNKWLDANTQISGALLNLAKGDKTTWSGVGGPVAIFSQTTQILSNYPFNYYLDTWGIISVNLALFNLLPFPGLDGWQVLVEIIEGIGNVFYKGSKKIKNKKNKENNEIIDANVVEKEENNSSDTLVVGNKDPKLKENSNEKDEWKIPSKVKNIVSGIGLIILFVFMGLIFIKDIFFR